jgi:hypothetical protein
VDLTVGRAAILATGRRLKWLLAAVCSAAENQTQHKHVIREGLVGFNRAFMFLNNLNNKENKP